MLNLRELNASGDATITSDPEHFSRFSAPNFRISDILGSIGEPLDHGQAERFDDNGDELVVEGLLAYRL